MGNTRLLCWAVCSHGAAGRARADQLYCFPCGQDYRGTLRFTYIGSCKLYSLQCVVSVL